jgi:hypothetical protein
MKRSGFLALLVVAGATLGAAQQSAPERLTARELFFVPAANQQIASAKTARPSQARPSAPAKAIPLEVAQSIEKKRKAPPAEMLKNRTEGQIVQAGYLPVDLKPLGMRYTLIKRVGSSAQEVPVDTAFRSGDRIQVAVETNESGYLYIIARGSSGAWRPLFPSPEVEGGNNHIAANKVTTVPSGYVFTFDEQAGEEKLFLVFSRQPEPNLEKLIYDLGTRPTPAKPNTQAKPVKSEPQPAEEPKVLLAMNKVEIRDDVVGNLRRVYARDLVVEKVAENVDASGYGAVRPLSASYEPDMSVATYVVNPSNSKDARVVADLSLIHR